MKPPELVEALREGLERRPEAERRDDDLVFTFVGAAGMGRGLGIRPMVLSHTADNHRIYGVNREMAVRWIAHLRRKGLA